MRSLLSLAGILMVIYGIGILGYQWMSDAKRQEIDQMWPAAISVNAIKAMHVQPIVAQGALGVGIVLVLITRRRS